jgi:predicted cation transporter
MALDLGIAIGLFIIFLIVLIGPFKIKIIEQNLEVFLFICGILALTISGFAHLVDATGTVIETGWRIAIITEALVAPLYISNSYHIPIGIVQVVLVVGLIIYKWHKPIHGAIRTMTEKLSLKVMAFILIAVLGLFSSVISAILAAIILVEMVNALPLARKSKVDLTVIACFSIGLGAALTPLGEPLSTIAISKLSGPPYFATFPYLIQQLAIYIVPGIIAYGIVGMFFLGKVDPKDQGMKAEDYKETLKDVIMRAVKVYVFIMALVFLGDGFKPIIFEYIAHMPPEALYWINTVSAILDNATLTAAEIGPSFSQLQINAALLGLLIAGGMLIPGNIPNIISAGKLGITSKEWARLGVPLGFVTMVIYFVILFVPKYLGYGS